VNSPRTQASPRRCTTDEIDQQDLIAYILEVGVHALYEVTVLQCVAVCGNVLQCSVGSNSALSFWGSVSKF